MESVEHHRPCLLLNVTDLLLRNPILEVRIDSAIGESLIFGWLAANGGARPGTWGSIRITYANGIILAPITLLRKSWNASVHLMIGKALVILGTSRSSSSFLSLSAFH